MKINKILISTLALGLSLTFVTAVCGHSKTIETNATNVTGNFRKHSSELVEGDYLITYDKYAMKAQVSSNRLLYSEITIADDCISNPDESIVWHIAPSDSNWTIYNSSVKQYAAGTGAKSQAALLGSSKSTGDILWTSTIQSDKTFEFVNVLNESKKVNNTLRKNGKYGFACYHTETGGSLTLYKLAVNEEPSIQFDDSNLSTIDEESDGTFVIKKTAILDTDTITWASSNDNVLLVDENTGYYVASKVSENTTVTVTAKATRDGAEIASASFEVTVMPKVAITGVTILNGSSATMAIGDTLKLSATVEPSNANQSVTWSSEDETICSVDEEGNVKALAEGTVLIKATSVSDATKFATISITANWTIKAARAASQSVTVKGVVTSIDTAQNIVTIQDETAAILLYGLNATQVKSISLGKIVKVSGKLTDFNGLAELTSIDTLEVLGDGNIPTPTILEKTSATDLKGLDSTIFVAEGKLETASKFASSDVKLTLNLTNGNSIFVYTKEAVAKAIASNWNTFVAKAGTIATIKFTLPLGWYNNPQLAMLPDMSKVESVDVDAVDAFVTNFMHPEIETTDSGTGKCSSEGWYLSAKEAYGKLSENQKKMFDTLDGYKDMKARFDAWAAVADTGTGLFSISSSSNNNSIIVIVCMSLILIASVAGYTFYRKRRA